MKEIKVRLTQFVMLCTLVAVLLTGIVGCYMANRIIGNSAVQRLKMQSDDAQHSVDDIMSTLESAVGFLDDSIVSSISSPVTFADSAHSIVLFEAKMSGIMRRLGENTPYCSTVYFRYDPDYTTLSTGKFYVKDSNGKMNAEIPTDIYAYPKDDVDHVGWFYKPLEAGEPVWVGPYLNKNIDSYIMSYVMPVKIDGITIGVVGMDIDFAYIVKYVNSVQVYDTGKEYILSDGKMLQYSAGELVLKSVNDSKGKEELYNAVRSSGYKMGRYYDDSKQMMFASTDIKGGLKLVIGVPTAEVYKDSYALISAITILMVVTAIFVMMLSQFFGGKIVSSAYTDKLTGLYNREYFNEKFKKEMKDDPEHHSLVILDIDRFKNVNDTYGHAKGDEALTSVAKELRDVFGPKALLARWGGDEFVCFISTENDLTNCKELLRRVSEDSTEICRSGYTLSVGIYRVLLADDQSVLEKLVDRADKALYDAKMIRNTVVVYNKIESFCREDSNGGNDGDKDRG